MNEKVFISHAGEDKDRFVLPFALALRREQIDAWVDTWEILPGDSIVDKIFNEGIKHADAFIVVLSSNSVHKPWVLKELDAAIVKRIEHGSQLIPLVIDDCKIPSTLQPLKYVKVKDVNNFSEQLNEVVRAIRKLSDRPALGSIGLVDKLNNGKFWPLLENAAIQAATIGGITAMGMYRKEQDWPVYLPVQDIENKNPSTLADLLATTSILQSLNSSLTRLSGQLSCAVSFLAEETTYREWFVRNLSTDICDKIHEPEHFFSEESNVLRAIIDGIDGTESFNRGLPLFCSSVAIAVGTQPRVSAIYDPIHNVVYSATLRGPGNCPESEATASKWQVGTGNRIDLVHEVEKAEKMPLDQEAVGYHLTRSNVFYRHSFLSPHVFPDGDDKCQLERLASAVKSTYALNTGVLAMAEVAAGVLGGFVNNRTNLWDIAAGDVLVKACKGRVTDFSGQDIKYTAGNKVSVIAAKRHLYQPIYKAISGK